MALKLKVLPKFPSRVLGGDGITVTKANGTYTIAVDEDYIDDAVPDFATQSEAEAGTDNTKIMTPLRAQQHLEKMLPVIFGAEYGLSSSNTAAQNGAIFAAGSSFNVAIGAGGKHIIMPGGVILTDTVWNASSKDNLTISGQGGKDVDFDTTGTAIIYTGSGSNTAFDFGNCKGLHIRDIAWGYNSATYSGVTMSWACNASVWNNNSLHDCTFYQRTTSSYTGTAHLYLKNVVGADISGNRFAHAQRGILGAFSNECSANTALIHIHGNDFTYLETSAIENMGFGWTIENNGIEPKSNGTPSPITVSTSITVSNATNNGSGLIRLTVSSTSGYVTNQLLAVWGVGGVTNANGIWAVTVVNATTLDLQGSTFAGAYTSGGTVGIFQEKLVIRDNKFADATGAGTWISLLTSHALTIDDNSFGGVTASTNGISIGGGGGFGVSISRNLFSSLATAVTISVASTSVEVVNNDFLNVTTKVTGMTLCDKASVFHPNNPDLLTSIDPPATNDELYLWDASASLRGRITLLAFMKIITFMTAEAAVDSLDEIPIYDGSEGAANKTTVANLLKAVTTLTAYTTPLAADEAMVYDVANAVAKKSTVINLHRHTKYLHTQQVVNFNSANTDTAFAISLPAGFTRWQLQLCIISGASAALTTATFGLFTGAGGTGTQLVASGTACTVATASEDTTNNMQSPATINNTTQSHNQTTIYFRVQTPQGSAATATVSIGWAPLS